MNENKKCFYLTYQGRVATPSFDDGEGVFSKVVALRDAFSSLGYEMELHADLIYSNEKYEKE